MGIAMLGVDDHAPPLRWPHRDAHDEVAYSDLEHLAGRLGMTFAAVKVRPVLRLVHIEEWTGAWQEKLIAAARTLRRAATDVKAVLTSLSARLGLAGIDDSSAKGLECFAEDGRERREVRIKWWDPEATTFRKAAIGVDDRLHELPDLALPVDFVYREGKPVLFGHYWMEGGARRTQRCGPNPGLPHVASGGCSGPTPM